MNTKKLTILTAALLSVACATAQTSPTGWASAYGQTDGGRGQRPVVATTYSQLAAALAENDTTPSTVYIEGRIVCPVQLHIKRVQNKSVIGLPGSALVNDRYTTAKDSTGILQLDRCRNIILQNLTFVGPGAFDLDANDNLTVSRTERLWVDHCDFQDGMDGNFDCNHGSDYITVSWCRFRYLRQPWAKLPDDTNDDHNSDHRFSNLWGSSDREARNSEGRLRTTFDHCWWDEGCRARMPFARFGAIHLLNCLYSSSVASVYIQARYKSNVLAEGCAFVNTPASAHIYQTPFSSDPQLQDYNLRFRNCLGAADLEQRHGTAPYLEPADHYPYTAQPAAQVEAAVSAGAGATLTVERP